MSRAEDTNRSTARTWLHYIVNNPLYFVDSFQRSFTAHNIEAVARELFKDSMDLGKANAKTYHRQKKLTGLDAIAEHIGIQRSNVKAYLSAKTRQSHWRKWRIPVWHENGEYHAYMGRLNRWAKHKRIGKYAN